MGKVPPNQIRPAMEKPSPSLSWPPPNSRRSSLQKQKMKQRLKFNVEAQKRFIKQQLLPSKTSYDLSRSLRNEASSLTNKAGLGWTLKQFLINSSLHGLKYVTYCRRHLSERLLWAFICLIAIICGLYFSLKATQLYYSDPSVIQLAKIGLQDHEVAFPIVTICDSGAFFQSVRSNLSLEDRDFVESFLSPMKSIEGMWDVWSSFISPNESIMAFNTFENMFNNVSSIKAMLQQIIIEATLILAPLCNSSINILANPIYCDAAFLSQDGLCYRINLESSKTLPRQELLHESQVKNFGHFLKKSLPDLDLSLSLNSVNELSTSTFVGFPTLNSSLWQNLQLCAKNYAAKADSDVLCRSLGHLGGGQSYYSREAESSSKVEVGNLLGKKLNCLGSEAHFLDCPSDFNQMTGKTFGQCKENEKMALLCNPAGLISADTGRITNIKGFPYVSIDTEAAQKNYFCQDNNSFGESEAKVFCRMLGWPIGQPLQAKNQPIFPHHPKNLYSTAQCQGDELHILDCDNKIISKCDTLVQVQCGPGFPLTLRLENPIQESLTSVSNFGHPVVDTTGAIGYICDKAIGSQVAQVMCKMLGFRYGRKLHNFGFYALQTQPKVYVFDDIHCAGDEETIFDCHLGTWQLESSLNEKWSGCQDDSPLAVACSSDRRGLDLQPILLSLSEAEQMFKPSTSGHGLAAIQTGHSLIYTPFCKSDHGFDDKEAKALCKSMGFPCGSESRQHQLNISSTFDNLGSGLKRGVYVYLKLDGMGNVNFELATECHSKRPFVVQCTTSQDTDDLQTCNLLHQNHEAHISHVSLSLRHTQNNDFKVRLENGIKSFPVKFGANGDKVNVKVSSSVIETQQRALDVSNCFPETGKVDVLRCQSKCRANFQLELCGCLPWLYSRTLNWDTSICIGEAKHKCHSDLDSASKIAPQNFSLALSLGAKKGYLMGKNRQEFSQKLCQKCVEMRNPCRGILDYQIDTFDMQNSQADTFKSTILSTLKEDTEESLESLIQALKNIQDSDKISTLNITLDRQSSKMYQRRLILEYELFLGCIGGIMAIFTGFSFIVLLEFLYFFTVRWWEDWHDPELNPQNFKSKIDKTQTRSNSDPELTTLKTQRKEEIFCVSKAVLEVTNEMAKMVPNSPEPAVKEQQKKGNKSGKSATVVNPAKAKTGSRAASRAASRNAMSRQKSNVSGKSKK